MLGEVWQGSAKGAENAAFLAIGTGVGLGLIVNGQLARGAKGAAGEIAYLPIGRDLNSPNARAIGAFELEVGAAGILSRYHASGAGPVESVRELFDRLETGDPSALRDDRCDGARGCARADRASRRSSIPNLSCWAAA